MDHSELGEPLNGFRYKFLEPSEYDAVLKLLEKYILPTMIPIGFDARYPEDWLEFFSRMMRRGPNLSYIAVHVESGEIAACRMVDLVEKNVPSDLNSDVPPYFKHKTNISTFKVSGDVFEKFKVFERFSVSKYANMFGLCVDEKYRKRGIAGEMYRRGLNYLQNRGFKVVICGFISPFTRRAGHKNGYTELARKYFHECKDEDGNILNPNSDPNDFVDWGYFDLRDRKIQ